MISLHPDIEEVMEVDVEEDDAHPPGPTPDVTGDDHLQSTSSPLSSDITGTEAGDEHLRQPDADHQTTTLIGDERHQVQEDTTVTKTVGDAHLQPDSDTTQKSTKTVGDACLRHEPDHLGLTEEDSNSSLLLRETPERDDRLSLDEPEAMDLTKDGDEHPQPSESILLPVEEKESLWKRRNPCYSRWMNQKSTHQPYWYHSTCKWQLKGTPVSSVQVWTMKMNIIPNKHPPPRKKPLNWLSLLITPVADDVSPGTSLSNATPVKTRMRKRAIRM